MRGFTKQKVKQTSVYFGHPFQFWKLRQSCEMAASANVDEMKKLSDVVEYDRVHIQKAIVNRVEERVKKMLRQEDLHLRQRRQKLKRLLEQEEEDLLQELITKQAMDGCSYCKERESKLQKYDEDLEKLKLIECKKALERQKIANGMRCTRIDEIKLKEMQKLQMEEKKIIEQEAREVENMWHQVLLHDVRRKEEIERKQAIKLKEEIQERRKAYDEQISSANRERRETLKREREEENIRLEKMKQKMEQDYYNAIKNKKDKQMANRSNFIIGHEMKLSRVKNEKQKERETDINIIKVATEKIKRENEERLNKLRESQQEKSIFLHHHRNEKIMAAAMEEETDKVLHHWITIAEKNNAERKKHEDMVKKIEKEKSLQDYRQHVEHINQQTKIKQQERKEQMEKVKRNAYTELKRRLDSANEELRKQIDYRNSLTEQIRTNKAVMETKLKHIECKQRPFTKKAITFKEAMRDKVNTLSDGERW